MCRSLKRLQKYGWRAWKRESDVIYFMNKNSFTYRVISISGAVVLIMALLQPFGIDRINNYKYPIIIGYGFLTAIAYILNDIITSYVFRLKRNEHNNNVYYYLIYNISFIFVMALLITLYASILFSGNIKNSFFDAEGNFELKSFWINCLYVLIITFFISTYQYFVDRNRILSARLKEEIDLNRALERRSTNNSNTHNDNTLLQENEKVIEIKGSTKESITLFPSQLQFIEAEGNYINIFYIDKDLPQKKTIRCTLKQVEELLKNHANIIRCHRAFIINIDKISHVDGNAQGYRLHINGTDRTALVSRAYASSLYNLIES